MEPPTETQGWRAWGASLLAQFLRMVLFQRQQEQQTQEQQLQEQRSPLQGGEGAQDMLDMTDRVRVLPTLQARRQEMAPGTERETRPTQEQDRTEHPQDALTRDLQGLRHRLQDRQQDVSQDRGQERER